MKKFTQKPRLVANGHETENVHKWDTYSSVIFCESVKIAFLYAVLNNLDILSCDISNAYLEDSCSKNLWSNAGEEFGSISDIPMKIQRALYCLKTAGNS